MRLDSSFTIEKRILRVNRIRSQFRNLRQNFFNKTNLEINRMLHFR